MSKYIVSGGAGFIGSNLVDQLLLSGHEVIVLDDFSSGLLENLPINHDKCKIITVDISNYDDLIKHKESYIGSAGIFHTSAMSRIQPAILNPTRTHEVNITGMMNILQMMRECNIRKIVFSSSSSIYGLKNITPQNEDMPADCLNPYSFSKFVGENYIKTFCRMYGISGISLRYFNVWGPREVLNNGDFAPVVGLFFRKILQENKPPSIVGDGQQRRDMTHVFDIVDANIKSMENQNYFCGEVFNIGSGKNYSILQFADMVLESLGLDKSYKEFLPVRPAESRETLANNGKARAVLGWQPKIFLSEKINDHRDYYYKKWNIK